MDESANDDEHFRWHARVVYRGEAGPVEVDHLFEELEELHDLIERGPHWWAIEEIKVVLNPKRARNLTIEQAEQL